jgi:hypothetical protein
MKACMRIKIIVFDSRKQFTNRFRAYFQFYKKLSLVIKSIGFVENKSDPCLLSNWNGKEVLLNGIYAHDCLVIRKEQSIQWLKKNSRIIGVATLLKTKNRS